MRLVGEAICSRRDVALPRFYLLGQQKSGTTTIATAFFQAGVVPMVDYRPMGNVPLYLKSMRKNHSRTLLAGNVKESNLLLGIATRTCVSPSCLARAQERWEGKFQNFSGCALWRSTLLADMSTDNFKHAERALTLWSFYGVPTARRLILVVIMREPLRRFQSGFYWSFNPAHFGLPPHRNHAHNRTLRMELEMLRAELPPDYERATSRWESLACNRKLDHWVRSMYALNWRPWLAQFDPAQFVALPMKWALADVGRATQLVAERFGVALHRQPHIMGVGQRDATALADRLNPNKHPTMEEDSADEQNLADLRWLGTTFFEPDVAVLAGTFSRAMPKGLVLGGANGSSVGNVLRHLKSSW